MRRTQAENLESAGQDSFVDVVTNLVGIMIVLVIIVGVRVKHVYVDPAAAKPLPAEAKAAVAGAFKDADPATVLAGLMATAGAIEADVHNVDQQVAAVEQEFAARSVEREQLATFVAVAEHELNARRGKLEVGDRADFDLRREAAALEQQLGESRQQLERVENERPRAVELKHVMTPISRAVFGKEVHFRLANGRISYVPLNELLDEAKSTVRKQLMERTSPNELTEHPQTVGPYAGFEMEYTMEVEPGRLQFSKMQIIPVAGETGEAVADALKPTSEFRRRLADHDASQTTVTVWVYPESFTDYRGLKDELYRLGFACAARPLPAGINISGSDRGTHSAAQ